MGRACKDFNIVIKNQNLKQTVNFVYQEGSFISEEGTISDVNKQIRIAKAAFQALEKVWSARDIRKTTKLHAYESLVLSCLLYNFKTWTIKGTLLKLKSQNKFHKTIVGDFNTLLSPLDMSSRQKCNREI